MIVREIGFDGADPNPGLVLRAIEIMGMEGRASLRGPSRTNGKVTGCFVRFQSEADAEKLVAAWTGFLELKKSGGKPAFSFAASSSFDPPKP